jgi:hypothetical protein
MADPPTSQPPPGAGGTATGGSAPPVTSAPPVPLDDDDTRGAHMRALARHVVTISLTVTGAILGFVTGTVAAGPAIGAAVAGGVVIVAVAVIWFMASSRAKEDFLKAYAQARGLSRLGRGGLPPVTPLLRRGDRRYASERMRGTLPGGEPGTLAHYTYEEIHHDSKGRRQTSYYHFTVALCDVTESAVRVGELYCQRRVGFRFLDGFEDVFRRKQRVEVESEAMDKRFETFADADANPSWLRQLFAPSFIVWLSEHAPENFAFELVAGALCVNVKGHADSAAELDALCEAAGAVAGRLREESAEQPAGDAPMPPQAV